MLNRRSLIGSLLGTVATVPFWGRFGFGDGLPRCPRWATRLPGFKLSVFSRCERGPLEEIWTPCIEQVVICESDGRADIAFAAAGLLAAQRLEVHGCSIWTPDNLRVTCRTFAPTHMLPGETLRITQAINLSGIQCDVDDWQYWAPRGAENIRDRREQNLRVLQCMT